MVCISLPDPRNKGKKCYIIIHQSICYLEYVKTHVKILQKGSEAYQYVVHNLTWSGVFLMSTLSNTYLHKVITLVLLTATRTKVFVITMTIFLSDYYDYF